MNQPARLPTENAELSKVQDYISQALKAQQASNVFSGGRLVTADLSTSETRVEHKLGRPYQGYIVVDKNAAEHVYTSGNSTPELVLLLKASGTVSVKLFVF